MQNDLIVLREKDHESLHQSHRHHHHHITIADITIITNTTNSRPDSTLFGTCVRFPILFSKSLQRPKKTLLYKFSFFFSDIITVTIEKLI